MTRCLYNAKYHVVAPATLTIYSCLLEYCALRTKASQKSNFGDSIMAKIVGHLVFIVVILTQGRLIPWSSAHGPSSLAKRQLADSEPNQSFNVDEEDFIHTPVGFDRAGAPTTVALNTEIARLKVTVVDNSSGELTACRVNVIGPDGNF